MNYLKEIITIIGGVISFLVGGFDGISTFLLILMLLDIITGFIKAVFEKKLDPHIMYFGGMKKLSIIIVIYITVLIDKTFIINFVLRDIVIMYFITNEGISFIENISYFIDLPDEFTQFFNNINKEGLK